MKISRSAYYAWLKRPAKLITAEQLSLYRRAKAIFEQSRNSLGYRTLRKRLCKEGFSVSAYGSAWPSRHSARCLQSHHKTQTQ
ncbi:hypothetical protein M2263_004601 [Providencia alcalifaciens]|nr:hypothetical protein [Providencia alcalifaciens]MCW2254931.1 hypothetical protein [Providencia alcalifaciens]MCW2258510.1 hypothetical protein [Providencia alcalifaciens]